MSLEDDGAFTDPVPDPPCHDCARWRSNACADMAFECGEFRAYAEFYRKPRTINWRRVQPEPETIWRRLAMMTTGQVIAALEELERRREPRFALHYATLVDIARERCALADLPRSLVRGALVEE